MALTVVGSIAFDSVHTPFGERERMLGGSAVHFALAASYFTEALSIDRQSEAARSGLAQARTALANPR